MTTPQTRTTARFTSRGKEFVNHPVIQDEIARGERNEHGVLIVETWAEYVAKMTALLAEQERYEAEVA